MAVRRSARGQRGETGKRGAPGARGLPGPAGPSASRADILAVVQDEFNELRKQMQIQIERTAQMQLQLDTIQGLVKQLIAKG
jgi:hypothetical protein